MILTYETNHYIFHYLSNSLAEQDIAQIAECQEKCFERICSTLNISYNHKISYWLYSSPKIIGDIFFNGSPCNGLSITSADDEDVGRKISLSGNADNEFIVEPYSVHAVYEDKIKCIGAHEDTHIISAQLCEPRSAFLCEGLAMFMEGKWWGIDNKAWAKYYIVSGELFSTSYMICFDEDDFYNVDSSKTYPVAGAWTEYVFEKYGADKYKQFYCANDYLRDAMKIFGDPLEQIHEGFVSWLGGSDVSEDVYLNIKQKIK